MMNDSVNMNFYDKDIEKKLAVCRAILRRLNRVVVAFSAGVDSTFLLALAVETLGGSNVLAAIGVSPSLPQRELADARSLAKQIGVELTEVPTGELDNPLYSANPVNRCYFCKHDLFSRLVEVAKERGFIAVVSGANVDDSDDIRPGLNAGAELGIRNPLMEAGLTKIDIHELSRRMNLSTWNKPAMACLASRVPYDSPITAERLHRIEQAENDLRDMGFRQVRVRDHGTVARIEVPEEQLKSLLDVRYEITAKLKTCGYSYIAMDLLGFRSGSANEVLTPPQPIQDAPR